MKNTDKIQQLKTAIALKDCKIAELQSALSAITSQLEQIAADDGWQKELQFLSEYKDAMRAIGLQKSRTTAEGMQARLFRLMDDRFSVALFDMDSGKTIPSVRIYPNDGAGLAAAFEYFDKLAPEPKN